MCSDSRRARLEKKHPTRIWQSVMRRLITPFLAVLVAIILVAAPIAAQAAIQRASAELPVYVNWVYAFARFPRGRAGETHRLSPKPLNDRVSF